MNALEQFIADNKLDPKKVMNLLQDAGAISDECILPADVSEDDVENAIGFLTL